MFKVEGLIDAKTDAFSAWLKKNEIEHEVIDAIPSEYIFQVDIIESINYQYMPHLGKHLFTPIGCNDVNNAYMIHSDDLYRVVIE